MNWITGVTEDGKLVGRNEPAMGKTELDLPQRSRREELELHGVFAAHRFPLRAGE